MVHEEVMQPYLQRVMWTRPGQSEHHIALVMGIGRQTGVWDDCWDCSERSSSTRPLPLDTNLGGHRYKWHPGSGHGSLERVSGRRTEPTGGGQWVQTASLVLLDSTLPGPAWPHSSLWVTTSLCIMYACIFCQINVGFLTLAATDSYLLNLLSSLCKWGN